MGAVTDQTVAVGGLLRLAVDHGVCGLSVHCERGEVGLLRLLGGHVEIMNPLRDITTVHVKGWLLLLRLI